MQRKSENLKNTRMKKIIIWVIACFITIGASFYQRVTGPTAPIKESVETTEGFKLFKLPKSGSTNGAKIEIPIKDRVFAAQDISGASLSESMQDRQAKLYYKHYPEIAGEEYIAKDMIKEGEEWVTYLPSLPPAGKWMYYIEAEQSVYAKDNPVIIRLRGDVPAYYLIPHIIFMFASMLLICVAAGFAIYRIASYKKYFYLSLISLLLGGFVFGPLVQHFAFGPFWTGFPLGMDLTDNKTLIVFLIMMLVWAAEVFVKKMSWKRWGTVVAAVVMLVVFSIPHSMGGSELDHQSGKIGSSKTINK